MLIGREWVFLRVHELLSLGRQRKRSEGLSFFQLRKGIGPAGEGMGDFLSNTHEIDLLAFFLSPLSISLVAFCFLFRFCSSPSLARLGVSSFERREDDGEVHSPGSVCSVWTWKKKEDIGTKGLFPISRLATCRGLYTVWGVAIFGGSCCFLILPLDSKSNFP